MGKQDLGFDVQVPKIPVRYLRYNLYVKSQVLDFNNLEPLAHTVEWILIWIMFSGGNARSSVYSTEYRQDYENDSSTDEEPMEDNSSDEEEDFVSK